MASGERCKTCDCQESEHQIPLQALNMERGKQWKGIPGYRIMSKWTRDQIRDYFVECGMAEEDIQEFFYDVVRCAGFSTTRRPNKNWVSYRED